MRVTTDFLIVGSGVAGLRAAIALAEVGDVLVLTKADPGESNTGYAQGGVAAAVGPDDSPELHARDTMEAGDGLCRRDAVDVLVQDGPRYVRELLDWGAAFDRDDAGRPALGREAAHSVRRVLHARDATGREIGRVLWTRASKSPRVRVLDVAMVLGLRVDEGVCTGATFIDRSGEVHDVVAPRTLLATGGAGQVFRETTNPAVATGDGMAMAFEAGARVADLEFVQFHPTVLSVAGAPRFLLSEALRGEGGRLLNASGERFVERYDPAGDLAPRDVVARAIVREQIATGSPVYLSMAHADPDYVRKRFPTIAAGLPRRRSRPGHRSDSGQPGRPLRDGRRRNRSPRPDVGGQPVRGRRGGLHRRARRQPPGQQLAARGAGVRRPCRGGHAGTDARRRAHRRGRGAARARRRQAGVGHAPTRCAS